METKIEYVLFDVAGTLLHKPAFFSGLVELLHQNNYTNISITELKRNHRILSEATQFPDRTNREFYYSFNKKLLFSMGILPSDELLEAIFNNASYLPWEKFEDTKILHGIGLPIGIISNFNSSLPELVHRFFGPIFKDIIASESFGMAKPNLDFYRKAIEIIGCEPENILYIGDSMQLDIEPAVKLGLQALLIDRDNYFSASKYAIQDLRSISHYLK